MLKIATLEDYDAIMEIISHFESAYPYDPIYPDYDKLGSVVQTLLTGDKANGLILLYLSNDRIAGMLAATVSEMLFNHHKLAHELMWWVEPEFRGTRVGIELLKAYEFWAQKIGCKKIQMSLVETSDAPKVERIYLKFGYQPVERAFLKDL